jgi:hypothetical protein
MLHLVIASALWMTVASQDGSDVTMLGPMAAPAWEMADGETPFPPGVTFSVCDNVIASLASKAQEKVVERKYSMSRRWGKILRAKLAERSDASFVTLITCWGSDSGIEIAAKVADR